MIKIDFTTGGYPSNPSDAFRLMRTLMIGALLDNRCSLGMASMPLNSVLLAVDGATRPNGQREPGMAQRVWDYWTKDASTGRFSDFECWFAVEYRPADSILLQVKRYDTVAG